MFVEIMCVFVSMFLFVVSCGFCFYCGMQVSKVRKVGKPKKLMPKKAKGEKEEKELDPISQGVANIFAFDGSTQSQQKRK